MPPIVLFEVIVLNMCIIYDIYIESKLNIYTNSKTNASMGPHTYTHTHTNNRRLYFDYSRVTDFTGFLFLRFSICLGIPPLICLALMSKAVWLLSEGQRDRAVVTFFHSTTAGEWHFFWFLLIVFQDCQIACGFSVTFLSIILQNHSGSVTIFLCSYTRTFPLWFR